MNVAMENHNILVKIKQTLIELIPSKDSRTNISPLDFVVSLIFCYIGDSKTPSLESIRREMKYNLNQHIRHVGKLNSTLYGEVKIPNSTSHPKYFITKTFFNIPKNVPRYF